MANVLGMDKQVAVISALAEGSGIRQIERITGVHRDTIMRLGVRVGTGCAALLDRKMRDLPCENLQFDVEVFKLAGHPAANRAYAWAYEEESPKPHREYVAVLGLAPVTSPKLAVRAAIIQEFRSGKKS